MKFKKEIIAAITCAVVLVGIFLTVSFIGRKDAALSTNNGNDKKVTETQEDKKKQEENKNLNSKKTDIKETEDKENKQEPNNPEDKKVNNDKEKSEENKKEDDKKSPNNNSSANLTKEDGVKEGIYVIKENDTLYSIANAYMPNHDTNSVIETIMKRNNLNNSNKIIQGQEIVIPYEVALETKSVAASTEDDKKNDNLKENQKNTNEKKEPSKETDKKLDEKNSDDKKENENDKEKLSGNKYEIKSGDNLYSIAKENLPEVSLKEAVEKIKTFNGIKDENDIKAGEVIYIPAK
ncbi:MAG: LysM peptidoglycan-binding domain-containing protein [Clostridium argentinense]|uniref:LysM peptidoglycan-binding domain-containing protein n=1 Tax=uncultured Clostridium sp. TaxID=59620 RepID=UPI001D54925C|nr:LysM peptidoglycan-binding domain-containing protein [uncultured Clostridium sp.]MBS5823435.1 LysM peptidoglycan-binding domain-containing protein [Clostridium argentinense]MDU1348580.1 LysM peptidoglycan-binding domain-containing protein [Clostridium argentinense]